MKVVYLISCLFLIGDALAASRYVGKEDRIEINLQPIEDVINSVISILKEHDPVNIAERVYNIIEYQASFKNIHAEGFSGIESEVTADVGFTAVELKLRLKLNKASSSVELWETNFPVAFGKGSAALDITNLEFNLSVEYSYFSGLQPSNIRTSVESVNAHITGIQNDENLSGKISNYIKVYSEGIINSDAFHTVIEQLVDKVLGGILNKIKT